MGGLIFLHGLVESETVLMLPYGCKAPVLLDEVGHGHFGMVRQRNCF